jgi:hypothetical protein
MKEAYFQKTAAVRPLHPHPRNHPRHRGDLQGRSGRDGGKDHRLVELRRHFAGGGDRGASVGH